MEGTEKVLSRNPEEGCQIDHLNVRFIPGYTVDLALYYTFDEDRVYFLSITKISHNDE